MAKHSEVSLGARHPIHNYEFADTAARSSASGFVAADLGKVAKQSDDNSYWVLQATTPTWAKLDGIGGVDADAIHDNVAAEISVIASKATPAASDVLVIEDSAAAFAKKSVLVSALPGDADAIHDNVSAEISAIADKPTPAGDDLLIVEDSAAGFAKKSAKMSSLPGGGLGQYGDGSDGIVTISSNTSLSREMYYDELTIDSSSVLKPNGYRVFCKTRLTVEAGSSIVRDGGDASGATKGAATVNSSGTLNSGGQSGGNGSTANGAAGAAYTSIGYGGDGGGGGDSGGNSGGAGGVSNLLPADGHLRAVPWSLAGQKLSQSITAKANGGGGGGGGGGDGVNSGGGGGGGAHALVVAAKTIVNSGAISANGGDGADGLGGNAAGGGGGGGGWITLLYDSFTGNAPTVAGGAGGAGQGTGTAGTDGESGTLVSLPNR